MEAAKKKLRHEADRAEAARLGREDMGISGIFPGGATQVEPMHSVEATPRLMPPKECACASPAAGAGTAPTGATPKVSF